MGLIASDNNTDISDIKDDPNETDIPPIRKTVYCLRHAQSEYNEAIRAPKTWLSTSFWMNSFDPQIRDPLLSNKGRIQTNNMSSIFSDCSFLSLFNIELIVTSPLKRAINTCFGVLNKKTNDSQIIINPLLNEWIDSLSDIGSPKSELINYCSQYNSNKLIDFSNIKNEIWWNFNNFNYINNDNTHIVRKENQKEIQKRIKLFKNWILNRSENNILIVGHSRWFREFVGSVFKLNNCEMMKVTLNGMDIESWEYINFDDINQNKNKITNIINQTKLD